MLQSTLNLQERLGLLKTIELLQQLKIFFDFASEVLYCGVSQDEVAQVLQQDGQHSVIWVLVQSIQGHKYSVCETIGVVGHLGVYYEDVLVATTSFVYENLNVLEEEVLLLR